MIDEYSTVVNPHDSNGTVHALWKAGAPDVTMCGQVESLDVRYTPNRSVSCVVCQGMLKKVRQQRSREGTARHQQRMREQAGMREEVEEATAQYPSAGNDIVYVPNDEIDRLLIGTLTVRAATLRANGFDRLASELESTAGLLTKHTERVNGDGPAAIVNEVRYIGPERRMRPRLIHPDPGQDL